MFIFVYCSKQTQTNWPFTPHSHDPSSSVDGASSRTQSQSSSGHSDSPRPGQPEGDFTLPHYGVQQIPQTYKELAEPWIKVSPGGGQV